MIQHTPQHLSRLQRIFTKRIVSNGLLPFLDLEKAKPYSDCDIIKKDIFLNDNDNDDDDDEDDNDHYEPTPYYHAATHLRVSPPSSTTNTSCDRNTSDFLSAFGILKSVPNPPLFEKNQKRLMLFNPPPQKTIILNEQYHINNRKFGGKFGGKRIKKNDFVIVPTPFIFDEFNHDDMYDDDEMYDYDEE